MKKHMKTTLGIVKHGFVLGAGASALASMGGAAATNAATGLSRMSGALPTVGTLGGLGMTMDALKGMRKATKRRRR